MTTFTDGAPPSVNPEPDDGSDTRGRSDQRESDDADDLADEGPSWLLAEIQRRIATGRSSSGGRHARRDTVGSPGSVGYVPRHSVATPGPGAPRPGPVSPQPSELLRRERTGGRPAWSGPPRRTEEALGRPQAAPADPADPAAPTARTAPAAPVVPATPAADVQATAPSPALPRRVSRDDRPAGGGEQAAPVANTPAPPAPAPAPAAGAAPAGAEAASAPAPAPVAPAASAPVAPVAPAAPSTPDAPLAAPAEARPAPLPAAHPSADAPSSDPPAPVPQVPSPRPRATAASVTAPHPVIPPNLVTPPTAAPAQPPAGPPSTVPPAAAAASPAAALSPEAPPASDPSATGPGLVTLPSPAVDDATGAPPSPPGPVRPGPVFTGDPVFTARTPVRGPIDVPEQRGSGRPTGVGPPQAEDQDDLAGKRVRVVLAERKGVARPVRTVVDIQEGTGVGELLRSNLIGSQLAVALRFAVGAGLTLGLLPLLFAMVPEIGRIEVLGLRLPWLLLGVLVYPLLFGLGLWHARTAERVEQNFADHVQD